MTTMTVAGNSRKQITFEDLKGLRAEGYVRDSTLDQRDGFGAEIQRKNILRFAENYGLALGSNWYTEFVTSFHHWDKRQKFHQFLDDAKLDTYDVLLVDHTSRFGRNQAECIRYKEQLSRLGKVIIFVSQGIISGSDRDFLSERINETLDEQYSRNLSRYVSSGMAEKAGSGLANGLPPLGYKSEIRPNLPEYKVPNPETMSALLALLRDYASGCFSYREVADRLNAAGYRTRNGRLFTGYCVRDVLANRFYEGKVVYHGGQPDEVVGEGVHEVTEEVRLLWRQCQQVKSDRLRPGAGRPRGEARSFPFARVLTCHFCRQPYYGEAVNRGTWTDLRLSHERRAAGRACAVRPRSRSVISLVEEFGGRVAPYLHLPQSWKAQITTALQTDTTESSDTASKRARVEKALENIRKQHKWSDLTDEQYRQERQELQRQLKILAQPASSVHIPNLERAAQLLDELPALWSHPGVTDVQREALIDEVFTDITIAGKQLMSVEPKPMYEPLFATIVTQQKVGNSEFESAPPPPETRPGHQPANHKCLPGALSVRLFNFQGTG